VELIVRGCSGNQKYLRLLRGLDKLMEDRSQSNTGIWRKHPDGKVLETLAARTQDYALSSWRLLLASLAWVKLWSDPAEQF